ncbi:protein SHQ1 homolog isoform X2 [Boleophthalmus pectinirostris]|uniref:protein SHQ1 homolog isoform X2 n=1 Tax=Boleophthalmus pectinirostris TaxID=150288 RepID=UPI00242FBAE4|nr:protein SHQ1 homolog isoform X2 [Boleophthalmus pectinirostris]
MITPAFELSQDPDYLTVSIRVPYTRTSEFDLYIDGNDFKFFAKPYFLRLTLPGRIVEDGREKATFNIDKGLFTLRVAKETAGEHFEGLDLLTSLLAPKGSKSAKPLIEEITACAEGEEEEDEEGEEEFDWQIEQQVYQEMPEEQLTQMNRYGFGNQRTGVFARLQEELADLTDIKNPEGTTAAERRQARQEAETTAFSPDHYLADLFEDDEIKGLLNYKPWWTKLKCPSDQEGETGVFFTEEEKEQLRRFTNRSYLFDKTSRGQVWLSLVDILLAYCYEVRSTEGEHNVESPWTVRKLSGTLSWLEAYSSLQDTLVSFGRRVLCFPLYRHFDMVSAAIRDTAKILQLGKSCVLKCLLDVHKVFRENEPAYILNDLYITDYCIWIQRVKSKKVTALAGALQKTSLEKKDLGLELEELEKAAFLVQEEENSAVVSHGNSSSTSSDSSGSSESEESESEGLDCANTHEERGGGGGGELRQHSPPLSSSTSCTIPRGSFNTPLTANKETSAQHTLAHSSRQLIQELEELTITEETRSSHSEQDAVPNTKSAASEKTGNAGNFLEVNPRKNPLHIVQENCEESDYQ